MFSSITGDVDLQKDHINGKGEYVITAGVTDNGILGKTDVNARKVKKNTITVDMFGNSVWRDFNYKLVTHARVFSLIYKAKELTDNEGLFFASILSKILEGFSYSNMCSWNKIQNSEIRLPVTLNGEIVYDLMDKYIRAVEKLVIKDVVNYKNKEIAKTREIISCK